MREFQRYRIEGVLTSWGQWVREGRTWANRLGYPGASPGFGDGVEPATTARRTPQHFRAEDTHQIDPRRSISSTRVSRSRSAVPLRTLWDAEITRVDRICNRLPDELKAVAMARYVQRMSVRQIANETHQSKNRIERECAEVIAYVAGARAMLDSPDKNS